MLNTYLANQMSGPYAQGFADSFLAEYQTLINPLLAYYAALSIQTADANDLLAIGYLVGYPWPTAPEGTFDDDAFALSSADDFPEASVIGMSSADGSVPGGLLVSALPEAGVLIPIAIYRQILTQIAYLKYYGLTWTSIDHVVSSFGLGYVYQGINDGLFTFGAEADFPVDDAARGFSEIGETFGGGFASSDPSILPDSDIYVSWTTPLTAGNLWVLQEIFFFVCTTPQVFIRNGLL